MASSSRRKKEKPQLAYLHKETHNGKARDYIIENFVPIHPEKFLKQSKREVKKTLKKHIPSKTNFKLHCVFKHINNETQEESEHETYLSTPSLAIQAENEIDEVYKNASEIILDKFYSFMIEKSGWHLKEIKGLHLHISEYNPIRGSSFVELPRYYKEKKGIVNILNDDIMCGKWAITISLDTSEKNRGRVTKKVIEDSKKYVWDGISFPLTTVGIKIFERNNRDIGINAYTTVGDEGKDLEKITPLYLTKKEGCKIATIFVVWDHWCTIVDENSFLNDGERNRIEICRRCGYKACGDSRYSSSNRLKNHLRYCEQHDYCKETFPSSDRKNVKFTRWDAIIKHPCVVTFDFECLLKKCEKGNMKNTKKIEEHFPISWGINIDRFDEKNKYFSYTGEDAAKTFAEKLDEIV